LEGDGMNVGQKADHVRAARDHGETGGHHCHWPDCDKDVPPAMWGCSRHWFALPPAIRTRIWRAYRPGQEDSKTPSETYVEAARAAQDWIRDNPDKWPKPPKAKPPNPQGSLL
jgi:hypothetical protein